MSNIEENSQEPGPGNQDQPVIKCEFCGAVSGEPHPVRAFKVKLSTPLGYPEDSSSLACQICRVAYRDEQALADKKKPVQRFNYLIVLGTLFLISVAVTIFIIFFK